MSENKKHKIEATVFSMNEGFRDYSDIKAIKIVDEKYNILIMEDYLPVIGEVHGKVSIAKEDEVINFDNISAFYKHSHNKFELLIKEYQNVG